MRPRSDEQPGGGHRERVPALGDEHDVVVADGHRARRRQQLCAARLRLLDQLPAAEVVAAEADAGP